MLGCCEVEVGCAELRDACDLASADEGVWSAANREEEELVLAADA